MASRTRGFDRFRSDLRRAQRELDMPEVYPDIAQLAAQEISRQSPRLTGALASSPEPSGGPGRAEVMLPKVYSGVQNYGWVQHGIRALRYVEKARAIVQAEVTRRLDTGIQKVLDRVRGA